MIKLVALDLDGTLLDEKKEIPAEAKARLIALKDQGVKIILATGRTFESAKRYYYELELDTPFIGCNGGVIYLPEEDRLVEAAAFTREEFIRVSEKLADLGVFYQYYGLHCIFVERLEFGIKRWNCENNRLPEAWRMKIRIVEDSRKWAENEYVPIYKILARSTEQEKLDEVTRVFAPVMGIDTVTSLSFALDIGPADCTKGKALKSVGEMLDIEAEAMMAVGDNDNDQEMIRYAGIGIAMADATEAAIEAADFCMDEDDGHGVVAALNRFL